MNKPLSSQGYFAERWQEFKRSWRTGEPMRCPACHGSGEPTGRYRAWAETVYWKGRPHSVCHNCEGSGIV